MRMAIEMVISLGKLWQFAKNDHLREVIKEEILNSRLFPVLVNDILIVFVDLN